MRLDYEKISTINSALETIALNDVMVGKIRMTPDGFTVWCPFCWGLISPQPSRMRATAVTRVKLHTESAHRADLGLDD